MGIVIDAVWGAGMARGGWTVWGHRCSIVCAIERGVGAGKMGMCYSLGGWREGMLDIDIRCMHSGSVIAVMARSWPGVYLM